MARARYRTRAAAPPHLPFTAWHYLCFLPRTFLNKTGTDGAHHAHLPVPRRASRGSSVAAPRPFALPRHWRAHAPHTTCPTLQTQH